MSKAIICPHCGSSRIDILDTKYSKNFYQCRECDVYIDPRTIVDKTNNFMSEITKFSLLILAIDDTESVVDLVEDIIYFYLITNILFAPGCNS